MTSGSRVPDELPSPNHDGDVAVNLVKRFPDPKDRPEIANYPALQTWLNVRNARCMSQTLEGLDYIEFWLVNGRILVIRVRPMRAGWDIYTASNSNDIVETLADADRRLGIVAEDTAT